MDDTHDTTAPADASRTAAYDPAYQAPETQADPLAVFAASPSEKEGLTVEVEHPNTGKVLMEFVVSRFGGSNNTQIVRVTRELKSKLTQGQRRAIDNDIGDPDLVARLNRQVFVRVAVRGWTMIDPLLAARWGEYSHAKCDQLFEAYPKVYDLITEKATDEEKYNAANLGDQLGN